MPLESATFIDGLNASNPVGSTDKVQTLDDHIRLIKSTILASFPGITGAVTPTHTELNFVNGVTSAIQTQLDTKAAAAALNASNLTSGTVPDARFPATLPALSGANLTALNASNLTSGTVADGRLSANVPLLNAANVFTAGDLYVEHSSQPALQLRVGASVRALFNYVDADVAANLDSDGAINLKPNNTIALTISSSGNFDFKTGTVLAAQIANSDSETLVAGQLHFIDGNATLPNLTAGQWIQVINDSASPITISKNGSDTTYWAATGATVSASFTLAARGLLTARCNPAGSSVYVSGSGITAAS